MYFYGKLMFLDYLLGVLILGGINEFDLLLLSE